MSLFFRSKSLDLLGFCGSVLCAVHCATLPVLLGFSFFAVLAQPWVEFSLVGFALLIAFLSLLPSYLKRHRKAWPIRILLLGFAFILVGRAVESSIAEVIATVVGAGFIALAHFINWIMLKEISPDRSVD